MDAQFGLLDVGITARAWNVCEPFLISSLKLGVFAFCIPLGLMPSKPSTTTYFACCAITESEHNWNSKIKQCFIFYRVKEIRPVYIFSIETARFI